MTRLVIISDTHGQHDQLSSRGIPEGDVLIHSGDIELYHGEDDAERFNEWLGTLPHKKKIIIAGNHDRGLFINGQRARKLLTNCVYLENDSFKYKGIKFYGSPISPEFCNWYFMAERGAEIAKFWKMIPDDTNVLITHGPAFGLLDINGHGAFCGCMDLLERMKKLKKLKLHCFGHIHASAGEMLWEYKNRSVKIVNACSVNEGYSITHQPKVIDL